MLSVWYYCISYSLQPLIERVWTTLLLSALCLFASPFTASRRSWKRLSRTKTLTPNWLRYDKRNIASDSANSAKELRFRCVRPSGVCNETWTGDGDKIPRWLGFRDITHLLQPRIRWDMEEDWIKCQIAELEKLLERCKDSEIMRISLQFRIDEFKKELNHYNH